MDSDKLETMAEVEPVVGGEYGLWHRRFGGATVRVLSIDGEWIDVEVLTGKLKGMGAGSLVLPGETKTVRRCHCVFSQRGASDL